VSEVQKTYLLPTLPGIKRDGTMTDGDNFSDGQWVRWQRGKVKKMGGAVRMADGLSGPSRALYVFPQGLLNNILSFHQYGIDQVSVDQNGLGGLATDRSPAGFSTDTNIMWQVDSLFDASGVRSLIVAQPSKTGAVIDDATNYPLYVGDPSAATAFTAADAVNATASGGVFAANPYTVLYGNAGWVQWSDANQPLTWTTGDAGNARIAGMKVVKGLSKPAGSGPGGLLWSLTSVVRMDYIGGMAIFRFSTIADKTSILSANSVVEHDGNYYWIGIDRFMMTNGYQVGEVKNDMNQNWFFNNLNYAQRNKVWAMTVPRYGEIWWFFPFGTATECTNAVIYNMREQTWYDVALGRSAGYSAQVFRYPVMSNSASESSQLLTLAAVVGTYSAGDTIKGATSGAMAIINSVTGTTLNILMSNTYAFIIGESIADLISGATGTLNSQRQLYDIYAHENGYDLVDGSQVSAIDSWFVSNDFGLPAGGMANGALEGQNRMTRLVRVEPDFIQSGPVTVTAIVREFAQTADTYIPLTAFSPTDGKIDPRVQGRSLRLKFESNTVGGYMEQGKILLLTEPGDLRS
jgi:hypothetical protein